MRRFQFSLESVLTVRKKTLQDERIILSKISDIYNKQNDVLENMLYDFRFYREENERYIQNINFNPEIVSNYNAFNSKLENNIKTQKMIMEKTKKDLERQKQIVQNAYIKVKSLENLKEKQKEKYKQEMLLEEIKQIDDIVNSRINKFNPV